MVVLGVSFPLCFFFGGKLEIDLPILMRMLTASLYVHMSLHDGSRAASSVEVMVSPRDCYCNQPQAGP